MFNAPFKSALINSPFSDLNKLLETLSGAPKYIGGYFKSDNCYSLKRLDCKDTEIKGFLDCSCCKSLESTENSPFKLSGFFYDDKHFYWEDFDIKKDQFIKELLSSKISNIKKV